MIRRDHSRDVPHDDQGDLHPPDRPKSEPRSIILARRPEEVPPSSEGIGEERNDVLPFHEEVHAVVRHLKKSGMPRYIDEILEGPTSPTPSLVGIDRLSADPADAEQDPLYDQAVQVVMETRKASISGVQRRLKIGYNRAARMVESMEAAGLVGPLQSNGSREILAPAAAAED